jgi:hypothetical protein
MEVYLIGLCAEGDHILMLTAEEKHNLLRLSRQKHNFRTKTYWLPISEATCSTGFFFPSVQEPVTEGCSFHMGVTLSFIFTSELRVLFVELW